MPQQVFFERFFNGDLPKEDKTHLEAIHRFITEEITEENINEEFYRTFFNKHGEISYSGHISYSGLDSVLHMLNHAQLNEKIESTKVENIINTLIEKNPNIMLSALVLAMQSPIILDVFLKKISREEKNSLFTKALQSPDGEIDNQFFVNPESIRVLINHGLSVTDFTESLMCITVSDFVRKQVFKHLKEFTTPEDIDSKEYAEFYHSEIVKVRTEILRRMKLALQFPSKTENLNTLGNISFRTCGTSFIHTLNYCQESFRNYSFSERVLENKELKKHFLDPNERKQIFEEASMILLENKKEGNRIILVNTLRTTTTTNGHAEGLLIFDDLLMKINRGARNENQSGGIVIFKKSPEAEVFFSTFPILNENNENEFMDGDAIDNEIAKIVLPTTPFILPMKDQKTGNCPWATSKAFVQAIYFAVIRKHLQNNHPEEDESSINEKAASIAKSMYKEFSMADRVREIKEYIRIHIEGGFKLADEKILVKMIVYAFASKTVEILETIKGNPALRNLIEKEYRRFLSSAIERDDVDFIRFIFTLKSEKPNEQFIAAALKKAIDANALNIISDFSLLGSLKDVKINDKWHPVFYSILKLDLNVNSDTVTTLIKHYNPVPYKEIIEAIALEQSSFEVLSNRKHHLETVQEFLCKQLIEESRTMTLQIWQKAMLPKEKVEELETFYEAQKSILKGLSRELPNAHEHERILEATLKAVRQDNTAILTHYKLPKVINPVCTDPESETVITRMQTPD